MLFTKKYGALKFHQHKKFNVFDLRNWCYSRQGNYRRLLQSNEIVRIYFHALELDLTPPDHVQDASCGTVSMATSTTRGY